MPQQLIYTSISRGLDLGRSGYCTAARSDNMRKALISELESFSKYDFSKEQPNTILTFRVITLGEVRFFVCSRTVNCGFDYTGRTNFIAHHVIFSESELSKYGSSVDFAANWSGWKSSWNEPARILTEADFVSFIPTNYNGSCWNSLCRQPPMPLEYAEHLLFRNTEERTFLQLLAESMALKKQEYWNYTWTTCLQKGDSARDFNFILGNKETPENLRGFKNFNPSTYVYVSPSKNVKDLVSDEKISQKTELRQKSSKNINVDTNNLPHSSHRWKLLLPISFAIAGVIVCFVVLLQFPDNKQDFVIKNDTIPVTTITNFTPNHEYLARKDEENTRVKLPISTEQQIPATSTSQVDSISEPIDVPIVSSKKNTPPKSSFPTGKVNCEKQPDSQKIANISTDSTSKLVHQEKNSKNEAINVPDDVKKIKKLLGFEKDENYSIARVILKIGNDYPEIENGEIKKSIKKEFFKTGFDKHCIHQLKIGDTIFGLCWGNPNEEWKQQINISELLSVDNGGNIKITTVLFNKDFKSDKVGIEFDQWNIIFPNWLVIQKIKEKNAEKDIGKISKGLESIETFIGDIQQLENTITGIKSKIEKVNKISNASKPPKNPKEFIDSIKKEDLKKFIEKNKDKVDRLITEYIQNNTEDSKTDTHYLNIVESMTNGDDKEKEFKDSLNQGVAGFTKDLSDNINSNFFGKNNNLTDEINKFRRKYKDKTITDKDYNSLLEILQNDCDTLLAKTDKDGTMRKKIDEFSNKLDHLRDKIKFAKFVNENRDDIKEIYSSLKEVIPNEQKKYEETLENAKKKIKEKSNDLKKLGMIRNDQELDSKSLERIKNDIKDIKTNSKKIEGTVKIKFTILEKDI